MIHYHGTPVSGGGVNAPRFLSGRHALIPFARQDDLSVAMDVCQSFVLNNSAFTYWRKGEGEVDYVEYVKWVTDTYRHPSFDWCLIPDKIDGTEKENQELIYRWVRSGIRALGVPVYHLHDSLQWLDYLVTEFQVVALGSSGEWATPGTPGWWSRMGQVMSVACDDRGRPRCKLHGLRMLDPAIFTQMPLHSADSTNAAVNSGSISRFGMYPAPTSGQRADVIAERIESNNSSPAWMGYNETVDMFSLQGE